MRQILLGLCLLCLLNNASGQENGPMVGATVSVAVAVEEALKK